VTIDIAGEEFGARGLMVLERNYLDIYTFESWSGNANLPVFLEGQQFLPTAVTFREGQTSPPGVRWRPTLAGFRLTPLLMRK
jgi:DNA topoisomerase-3